MVVLAGRAAMTTTAHHLVVALLQRGSVHLLDAGVRLQPYHLSRLIRSSTADVATWLARLHLQRAFTAHQVLAALETLPTSTIPLVVLDFLVTFYDDTLPLSQAQALLQRSLAHLERLQQGAPLLLTLTPPPQPARYSLFVAVCRQATALFHEPQPTLHPTQLTLW